MEPFSKVLLHQLALFFLQCIEYLLQNGASADDFPKTNGGNLLHFAVVNCLTSVVPENAACLNALLYSASGLGHKVNDVDDSGGYLLVVI